jgi:WD40 repeat protein
LATIAADQNLVITASKDRTIRAWSVSAALQSQVLHLARARCLRQVTPLQVLSGHDGSLTACLYLPDGKSVLTAANDASYRVYDEDGKCIFCVENMKYSVRCAATCKLTGMLFLGDSGGGIQVLHSTDFSFNRTQDSSKEWGWVVCIAASSNGWFMACCYQHGQCIVFDAANGVLVKKIEDSNGAIPLCCVFSGDSKCLAIGYDDGRANVHSVCRESIEFKFAVAVSSGISSSAQTIPIQFQTKTQTSSQNLTSFI